MTDSLPPRPPDDLRELVGDEVTREELERLRHVHALLRSVPPPPAEVPSSLRAGVIALTRQRQRIAAPWRLPIAAAAATAIAALFFALGTWVADAYFAERADFAERAAIPMQPPPGAPDASGVIRVGEPDASGNWPLRLEVRGLPELPPRGYYVLWLARDGEYGGTCGTFRVGEDGSAEVEMNASYRLEDFDAWVVTARHPDDPPDAEPRWLLEADVRT